MLHKIPPRGWIAYGHDIFMAAASFALSLYMRLGDDILDFQQQRMLQAGALFVVISALTFWASGLYRGVWRYASINDLWAITRAVTIAEVAFLIIIVLVFRLENFPRSVFFINWFVLMALLGGPRFFYRLLKDGRYDFKSANLNRDAVPVLLVGAGDGAELFLRSLRHNKSSPSDQLMYYPLGILSEQESRVGREIHSVPVLGTLDQLEDILPTLSPKPRRLVLTRKDMDGPNIRALFEASEKLGLTMARLPRLSDLENPSPDALTVRPIAIADVLGRAQTPLDLRALSDLIRGKKVLVTGAGGSIGSELVRQIAALDPARIYLFEQSEYALYSIDRELLEIQPTIPRKAIIGDVRDEKRIHELFNNIQPELVFHAAALKHVPLVEDCPFEGMRTNVMGTVNVVNACVSAKTAAMIMISTDKAVNPSNIMGTSKRIAEMYCQAVDLNPEMRGQTRFVTVRFGNVLGSTGSVVPLFERQIKSGGPVTVTDPEMTRYFMTIREAVELVLQASTLGLQNQGGGHIHVLDMGEPVKIIDLARQMIRLAGLKPDIDIAIEIVGARPGEKLFEEIFHGHEKLMPTACEGVLLAAPRTSEIDVLQKALKQLINACDEGSLEKLMAVIHQLVPEYKPPVP